MSTVTVAATQMMLRNFTRLLAPVFDRDRSRAFHGALRPALLVGAIGMTEPDAGTDLAALRTSAVLTGEEYVGNGQKIFTTGAHDADYVWLACRTDPEAPRHRGITILIASTAAPNAEPAVEERGTRA